MSYNNTTKPRATFKSRVSRAAAAIFASLGVALALTVTPANANTAIAQSASAQNAIASVNKAVAKAPTGTESAETATVLVYMNGSDLESYAGEATSDIAEMLESGIGEKANVVIETLGTREWQNYGIASDHTQRYVIKNGKLELVDDSLGQLDTTAPETLADFISWGVKNYPADRYMLIMWDHGAGPVYGFGVDEWQSEDAALTLDEMKQALEANKDVHFDFIGMDCCIMSSLETYVALSPYCDYAIMSEDFEPGVGWSYTNWMSKLEANPGMSTVDLGKVIVDDMISAVKEDPENGEATLALVDMSAVDGLYKAWVDFAYENKETLLSSNYSQEVEQHGRLDELANGASGETRPGGHGQGGQQGSGEGSQQGSEWDYGYSSEGYGYGYEDFGYGYEDYGYGYGESFDDGSWGEYGDWSNFYDSWDFDGSDVTMSDYYVTDILAVADAVNSDKSAALADAMNQAIVHYNRTDGEEGLSGIGVTLPYGDAEFYDQLDDIFEAVGIDGEYVNWLEEFVNAEGANSFYEYDFENFDGFGEYGDYGYGYEDYGYGDYGYEYGDAHGQGMNEMNSQNIMQLMSWLGQVA